MVNVMEVGLLRRRLSNFEGGEIFFFCHLVIEFLTFVLTQ